MKRALFIAGLLITLGAAARAAEPTVNDDPALPSTHFKRAQDALTAGDRQAAAGALRRGASIMAANAESMSGSQAQSLKEAARDVGALARDVAEGRVVSAAEIDRVVTRHKSVADLRSPSRSWDAPTIRQTPASLLNKKESPVPLIRDGAFNSAGPPPEVQP